MNRMITFIRRHRIGLTATLVAVGAVATMAGRCLPSTADEIRRSAVVVEQQSWQALYAHGRPVLFFAAIDTDSCVLMPSTQAARASLTRRSGGCWMNRWPAVPSCNGRIVTVADTLPALGWKADDVLLAMIHTLEQTLRHDQAADAELQYYLRVHGVQDEGYQQIAALATQLRGRMRRDSATLHRADSLLKGATPLTLGRHTAYTAWYTTDAPGAKGRGKAQKVACQCVAVHGRHGLMLLQTADHMTPDGVQAQYLLPWNTTNRRLVAAGHAALGVEGLAQSHAQVVLTEGRRTDGHIAFPSLLATDGSALYTPRGLFAGLLRGHDVVGRNEVSALLMKGGWR